MRARTSLACLILAGCGSSGSSSPDAASGADAAAMTDAAAGPSVRTVTCPLDDRPTVTTADNILAFTPAMTTISAHGIVKFVMSPAHDVIPNPLRPSDPGLMVDYGKTTCLMFDKAGTFNFMCAAHGFIGAIVVQ